MTPGDPTFPPLLTGIAVAADEDVFELACRRAATGDAGAGDVFWSEATARFEAAIVLEPEVETPSALQMHYTSMVAFGDAFGALSPAEVGMFYRWPGGLIVNAARVGSARTGVPAAAGPGVVPDWLVVGIAVALRHEQEGPEPGHDLENTTLLEEGCGDLDRTQLIESWSRHFLVWIDTWQQEGFRPVHDAWMQRIEPQEEEGATRLDGERGAVQVVGLDDEGNLLIRKSDGVTASMSLLERLRKDG